MSHDIEHRKATNVPDRTPSELRDALNPDRKKSRFENASRGKQFGIAAGTLGAIAAVGVSGFFGAKALGGDREAGPEPSLPTAEAPVTPGIVETPVAEPTTEPTQTTEPTSEPTSEPTPETPKNNAELPIEDQLIPAEFETYEAMSIDEFNKLPIDERLSYTSWLTRDTKDIADDWHAVTGLEADKYPGVITKDSTDQQISSANSYVFRGVISLHFSNYDHIDGTGIDPPASVYIEHANKILSSAFLNPTDNNTYNKWVPFLKDWSDNWGYDSPTNLAMANGLRAETVETPENTKNSSITVDGVEYVSRGIYSTNADGERYHTDYVYVPYTDYLGNDAGAFVQLKDDPLY